MTSMLRFLIFFIFAAVAFASLQERANVTSPSTTSTVHTTSSTSAKTSISTSTAKTNVSTTSLSTKSTNSTSSKSSISTTSSIKLNTTSTKTTSTNSTKTTSTIASPTATSNSTWWKPPSGITWQIVLNKTINATKFDNVSVYDIDLFGTPQSTINALRASGKKVICYFSAGTYENWRPDAAQFPASALGNNVDGWPGEQWLLTNSTAVRTIMTNRIALAKNKSCDAVDPDNIDGYANNNGFNLTQAMAIDYITFLATAAHSSGLAIGLKNCPEIVTKVIGNMDWELTEECALYDECDSYQKFITANKPVFQIEYSTTTNQSEVQAICATCPPTFSTLIKQSNLGEWYATCHS